MPWHLCVLCAWWMSLVYGIDYAIAMVLGHDCLLRPNELRNVTVGDVVAVRDARTRSSTTVIRLSKTKAGLVQSVSIDNPDVDALVRTYVACVRATGTVTDHTRLFSFTYDQFRRALAGFGHTFGLRMVFTPHSLRVGGSTEHWMRYRDASALQLRGRWRDLRSLMRYVQQCEVGLVGLKIPPSVQRLADRMARSVIDTLLPSHPLTQ